MWFAHGFLAEGTHTHKCIFSYSISKWDKWGHFIIWRACMFDIVLFRLACYKWMTFPCIDVYILVCTYVCMLRNIMTHDILRTENRIHIYFPRKAKKSPLCKCCCVTNLPHAVVGSMYIVIVHILYAIFNVYALKYPQIRRNHRYIGRTSAVARNPSS